MEINLPLGLVFGRLLAQRAGVVDSSTQNRAGLLMAAGGGLTPAGVLLANTAINAARSARPGRTISSLSPADPPTPQAVLASLDDAATAIKHATAALEAANGTSTDGIVKTGTGGAPDKSAKP